MTGATHTALVLSGGGARGAYQVGVLQGLVEHGFLPAGKSGVSILVGSSAGAINTGVLAAYADRFADGVAALIDTWSHLEAQQVFRTDIRSLGRTGARWAWDLSFGGALRTRAAEVVARHRTAAPTADGARAVRAHRGERRGGRAARPGGAVDGPVFRQRRAVRARPPGPAVVDAPSLAHRTHAHPRRAHHGVVGHPDLLSLDRDRRAALRRRLDPQHHAAQPRDQPRGPIASSPSACASPDRRPPRLGRASKRRRRSRRSPASCSTP